MKKLRAIIFLSLLVSAVTFFDGLPKHWEVWVVIGASLCVAVLAYLLRLELRFGKKWTERHMPRVTPGDGEADVTETSPSADISQEHDDNEYGARTS